MRLQVAPKHAARVIESATSRSQAATRLFELLDQDGDRGLGLCGVRVNGTPISLRPELHGVVARRGVHGAVARYGRQAQDALRLVLVDLGVDVRPAFVVHATDGAPAA